MEVHRTPADDARSDDSVLSESERERLARFRQPADQDRFRTAWVLARQVLSGHVGAAPSSLEFVRRCRTCGEYGHGKPSLVNGSPWEFSLSHAGGWVLLAVSNVGPVGVDIEAASATFAEIAAMVRAPGESADDLHRLWVRKEAVLKATGDGLAVPMSSFTISPPTWPADPALVDRLALADLLVPVGYAAAVAVIAAEPAGPLAF